jgi:hypothetical protein
LLEEIEMAQERFTLSNVRIAYAFGLFDKSAYEEGGEEKFKVKLIVPPNHKQRAAIDAVFAKLAKEEWAAQGPMVLKSLNNNVQKFCFIDGDNYPDTDGFPGNMIVSTSSKTRPTVVDRDGKTPVTKDDGIVYGGCYVNALLEFRTMDHKKFGKGLYCSLRGVQKFNDGDAFSSGAPPAKPSEFADLSTEETADDPTA